MGVEDQPTCFSGKELLELLSERDLISQEQIENAKKMRRSAEGRSVQISGMDELNNEALTMLAAGFFRGEPGKPAIPYLNKKDESIEN